MSDSHSDRVPSPGVSIQRIDSDRAGQRLDNFLIAFLKGVPKSRIYKVIRDGQVRVNGRRARQTQRLEEGDDVRIPPLRVAAPGVAPTVGAGLQERLARGLLYEDDWLFVYNKPAGLAVHGGSGVSLGLIESLRVIHAGEAASLELVHRLDRDTSGAIMVARHRGFLRRLQRLMQAGGMDKKYWLLCKGFSGHQRVIEAPLLRQTLGNERIVRVSREGKPSRTDFRLLERFGDLALVEATLETGRTHQIRVHAQYGGFPLIGDPKYGDPDVNRIWAEQLGTTRMFLHARHLGLRHPETGAMLALDAPLDEPFEVALSELRQGRAVPEAARDVPLIRRHSMEAAASRRRRPVAEPAPPSQETSPSDLDWLLDDFEEPVSAGARPATPAGAGVGRGVARAAPSGRRPGGPGPSGPGRADGSRNAGPGRAGSRGGRSTASRQTGAGTGGRRDGAALPDAGRSGRSAAGRVGPAAPAPRAGRSRTTRDASGAPASSRSARPAGAGRGSPRQGTRPGTPRGRR